MIALIGAFRRLHLPKQRIHFGYGHGSIGTHGMVACHSREDLVAGFLDAAARPGRLQVGDHVTNESLCVRAAKQCGHFANDQAGRPTSIDHQPEPFEQTCRLFGERGFRFGHSQCRRHE